jgi:crotonobetainyl-CoA:carnitine CoA-transferase CaiB-like acyl-CoA transferase
VTLEGLRVVEVALGASDLGLGLAGGMPGRLLADLGADVTRVVDDSPQHPVPWGRVWHRGKAVVTGDPAEHVAGADVVLIYGDHDVATTPEQVVVRCDTEDGYTFLVEARAGFCTQLAAHRPGPMLVDVKASASGTAWLMTVSALELLRRRFLTGRGGEAETSLYDGLLATLGCMIGRSERATPKIESYWAEGSFFPNFLYRCADGELLQIWFGGKGMYPKVIEVLGDEPSEEGYYAEQMNGLLNARAERWKEVFLHEDRPYWIHRLRSAGVACEPVLAPGEALADPHLAAVGLAVEDDGDTVLGPPLRVTPLGPAASGPLDGLRVVDFSAFVAGPLAAQVLADLGADVVKVEPPGGEAMRAAAYAIAACQRGKRSLALDISDPAARPVVDELLAGADVVLHNFRVGVAERLGIDAEAAAALRPGVVHCHASAFGSDGPRAKDPGNDALMQALTGFERAVGGEGNDPIAGTWIPIDMTGGWLAAIGILAGLVGRARTGHGQRVETSLLGAGMLLNSGVHLHEGEVVRGPALDGDQLGWGPRHRLHRCAEGTWLAVVVPTDEAWAAVDLDRLEDKPAADWLHELRTAGVLAEVVEDVSRDEFRSRILADPVRAVAYETDDWGHFEQIGPLLRVSEARPDLHLPGVGEHTREVLAELGFTADEVDALFEAEVAADG